MSRQQGRYSGLETGGRPVGLIGSNGRLSLSQLLRCETQPQLRGAPAQYLWAPYARSFDQMTRAAAEDGVKLILIVGYRDYAIRRASMPCAGVCRSLSVARFHSEPRVGAGCSFL